MSVAAGAPKVKSQLTLHIWLLTSLFCYDVSPVMHAQELSPIPIKDFLEAGEIPALTRIQLSPDATWVAYTLRRSSPAETEAPNNLAKWHTASGVPVPLRGSNIWLTSTKTRETR